MAQSLRDRITKRLLESGVLDQQQLQSALEHQKSEGGRLSQILVDLGYVKQKDLLVTGGRPLLQTLSENGVFLPSACGGKGTCGYCKVRVTEGGGPVLPTETPYLDEEERKNNVRISCQLKIKEAIKIEIPEELFQIKEYRFDRIFAFIREDGFISIFFTRMPRIPGKTLRNLLLLTISWIIGPVFIVSAILFLMQSQKTFIGIITTLALLPILSFAAVSVGLFITNIFANNKRNSIIQKARVKLRGSNAVIIGITGSFGKSSVKEFLYEILKTKFKVAKTDNNMNTDVGVAMAILSNLEEDTEYFIAEMGAYKKGEIRAICDLTHPKYGIITAIGNQHLALFGSMQNLIHAKKELAEALPADGKLYINGHISQTDELTDNLSCDIIRYGQSDRPDRKYDAFVKTIRHTVGIGEPNLIRVTYKNHAVELSTQLIGIHNMLNLISAVVIALDLGVEEQMIQTAVSAMRNIPGKLSRGKGLNGSTILSDVYSSNLDGFLAGITTLQAFPHKNKFIASGGIIELGKQKHESYTQLVEKILTTKQTLLTTDSYFREAGIGKRGVFFRNH